MRLLENLRPVTDQSLWDQANRAVQGETGIAALARLDIEVPVPELSEPVE